MAEKDPVVAVVESSLKAMEDTLRQQSHKIEALGLDVHKMQLTLTEMAVQDDHWVSKEAFVRLEGQLRAAAKAEVLEIKLKLERWTGVAVGLGLISFILSTLNAIKSYGAGP